MDLKRMVSQEEQKLNNLIFSRRIEGISLLSKLLVFLNFIIVTSFSFNFDDFIDLAIFFTNSLLCILNLFLFNYHQVQKNILNPIKTVEFKNFRFSIYHYFVLMDIFYIFTLLGLRVYFNFPLLSNYVDLLEINLRMIYFVIFSLDKFLVMLNFLFFTFIYYLPLFLNGYFDLQIFFVFIILNGLSLALINYNDELNNANKFIIPILKKETNILKNIILKLDSPTIIFSSDLKEVLFSKSYEELCKTVSEDKYTFIEKIFSVSQTELSFDSIVTKEFPDLLHQNQESPKSANNENNVLNKLIKNILENKETYKTSQLVGSFNLTYEHDVKSFKIYAKSFEISGEIFVQYNIYDVTELINSKNLVEKVKIKSLYLSKIAHELKNPVITINELCESVSYSFSGMLECIAKENDSSDDSDDEPKNNQTHIKESKKIIDIVNKSIDSVNFIVNTGNYLMSLIVDLNYFSKSANSGNEESNEKLNHVLEIVELIPLVDFCINIFKFRQKRDENKKALEIKSYYGPNIPEKFETCPNKLKQILINLLSNSYKFTVSGFIKLFIKSVEKNGKKYIRFEITDTGSGISQEKIQKLGEPFFLGDNQNLNSNGTGLGICIVKDMLKQLNSSLEIHSVVGKGSSFIFDLEVIRESENNDLIITFESDTTLKNFQPFVSGSLREYLNQIENNPEMWNLTKKEFGSSISDQIDSILMKTLEKERTKIQNSKVFDRKIKIINLPPVNQTTICKKSLFMNTNNDKDNPDIIEQPEDNSKERSKNKPNTILAFWKKYHESSISKSIVPNTHLKHLHESRKRLLTYSEENSINKMIRIMVCDDESGIRLSIKRLVSKFKEDFNVLFEIEETSNGIECLFKIYTDFTIGDKFDCLLIDEDMPFMKGSCCVKILKNMINENQMNKIKIISISSIFDSKESIDFLLAQGCDEIVPKPLTKNDLMKIVESLMS